jgi:replicative DNA helicase
MILCDPASERAVLSGICKYGEDAYLDVADILQESSFTIDSNSIIYKCLKHICENGSNITIDIASIYATGQDLGVANLLSKKEEAQHLRAILDFPVSLENVRKFAAKIRKLEIARLLRKQLEHAGDKLLEINGNESITSILGVAEDAVFNFSSLLNDNDNNPIVIGKDIDEYIKGLEENKIDQIGIPTGFPIYDQAIGGGLRKGTVNVIAARPKAQPLTAKILTPNGWKLMKDIKIGDVLVDPSKPNATCKVIGVYPFGKKEVLEFTFSDGSKTQACEDHYWKVKNRRWNIDNFKVLSFREMQRLSIDKSLFESDGRAKWQFPLTKPINFSNKKEKYYIDPYVLGCILGDGCITQNTISFSTADHCMITTINKKLKDKYFLKKKPGINYDYILNSNYNINRFRLELNRLGLHGKNSYQKFIPKEYKYSSIETRTKILQGLFDTDGFPDKAGIEYLTASKKLSEDVKEIVLSLGGLCTVNIKKIFYRKQIKKYYRLYIKFNDSFLYFSLKRKRSLCKQRTKPDLKRGLIGVKSLGKKEVQCIKVDTEDGLYITDNFIVTHNTGKTLLSDNIGFHIAHKHNIPVLNMDTEMNTVDHINRVLAMMTEVEINSIETGKFAESPDKKHKILEAAKELKSTKIFYKSIAGKPFEEQLSIMRRWILKEVGLNDDGTAKPCVIFYDYLKLMDSQGMSQDLKEYQILGFMMTSLHNFAVRYQVPVVAFIQLNRDGITKESTDTASGSDRIIWLCSNFTIFKRKSDEEIAEDGMSNGNRKLVPLVSRHGGGLDDNDYINCYMKGWCAKITEGKTRLELLNGSKTSDEGFIVDDESNDAEIPFA